jgi:mRNA interferase YafQ
MTYRIVATRTYKRALKRVARSGTFDLAELEVVITMLSSDTPLHSKYADHTLIGPWKGYRECHVRPDVLLIYKKDVDLLILVLVDLGSHSTLFG